MTIHPLFAAPTRPAPVPILFPFSTDDLLWERMTARVLAGYALNSKRVSWRDFARQDAWAFRLDRRIAQVVS